MNFLSSKVDSEKLKQAIDANHLDGTEVLPVAQLLLGRGADLSIRVKLPGHYEREDEIVECTRLGYALRFPGAPGKTVALLRERGAVE